MKKRLFAGLVLTLFFIASVSAGIYFTNPESYYNLGDVIKVNVTVSPVPEGLLSIDLICDGNSVEISKGILDEGFAEIKLPLNFFTINEVNGNCYFLGEYPGGVEGKSREFEISSSLDVILEANNLFVKPGEGFVISGDAKRLNGGGINGSVEITIPLLKTEVSKNLEKLNECILRCEEENEICVENCEEDYEENNESLNVDNGIFYGEVVDGKFSVNLTLADDTPAGDYRIDVRAYESDSSGRTTSESVVIASLNVLQVLSSIDIAISNLDINPGEILNFKPFLLDQSGNSINEKVSVIIKDNNLNRIFEKILQSGETTEYKIPSNLSSGYYDIESSAGEISSVKKFYVNEKAIVSFDLRNSSLIVTNIGNVAYKKDIQIDMNGKSFVKKINLELGEQQEFVLTGQGDYDIKVSDGENEVVHNRVALTGHAVNVESIKKGFVALNTPIIWIFFIIVLGAGILFLFRNILKKKSFTYPFKEKFRGEFKKFKLKKKTDAGKIDEGRKKELKENNGMENKAEQVLVLKGNKNSACVLALKIKNKLSKTAKQNLQKIMSLVNEKGAVYESRDYLIAVFSPLMTKSFKNEIICARTAELLKQKLKEHNKKFVDKIEFGVGINSGDVINKIENGKLKFTALGNLISGAKRIAEASNEQILLTKEAYEKSSGGIKASKKVEGVYEVKRIIDAEKNKKFIDGFLKRIGSEKNKKGEGGFSLG